MGARVWLLLVAIGLASACASQTICDYVTCVENVGGQAEGGGDAGGSGGGAGGTPP